MFFLLFCGIMLVLEIVGFVFYFLPLFSIDVVPFSLFLDSSRTNYDYTMLNCLNEAYGIFTFILTILVIVMVSILLIYSIKVFKREKKGTKTILILNIVLSILVLLQLIIFIQFKNTKNYYETFTGYSWLHRNPYPLLTVIFVLFIINLILSFVMLFISGAYNFSTKLKNKVFFNLLAKEGPANEKEEFSQSIKKDNNTQSKNIDLLMRLNELRKDGAISEEEYNEKKKDLL